MPTPQQVATQLRQLAGEIEGEASQAALEIIRDSFGLTAQLTALWKPDQPPDSNAQVFTIQQTIMRKLPDNESGILRYIPVFYVLDLLEIEPPSGKWLQCRYTHPDWGATIGWVKAEDTEMFYPCEMDINTADLEFGSDLEKGIYIPQDTPAPGARAKQYLSLEALETWTGKKKYSFEKAVHYNLCGPFCAAAINEIDVIPTLGKWLLFSEHLESTHVELLKEDAPLGLAHIRQMLAPTGHDSDITEITFSPAFNPLSARMLKGFCQNGKLIAGVGIDRSGIIRGDGSKKDNNLIRHWVVILDVLPCGTGGFVRLYNPFQNREETVEFLTLWYSMFRGGAAAKVLLAKGM